MKKYIMATAMALALVLGTACFTSAQAAQDPACHLRNIRVVAGKTLIDLAMQKAFTATAPNANNYYSGLTFSTPTTLNACLAYLKPIFIKRATLIEAVRTSGLAAATPAYTDFTLYFFPDAGAFKRWYELRVPTLYPAITATALAKRAAHMAKVKTMGTVAANNSTPNSTAEWQVAAHSSDPVLRNWIANAAWAAFGPEPDAPAPPPTGTATGPTGPAACATPNGNGYFCNVNCNGVLTCPGHVCMFYGLTGTGCGWGVVTTSHYVP